MSKARIAFHAISFINFVYKISKHTKSAVKFFNAALFTRKLMARVRQKRKLKLE